MNVVQQKKDLGLNVFLSSAGAGVKYDSLNYAGLKKYSVYFQQSRIEVLSAQDLICVEDIEAENSSFDTCYKRRHAC